MQNRFIVPCLLLILGVAPVITNAQDLLTGDTRLSCEAILCLSSGTRPSECSPSLNHYYGIHAKHWSDTLKKRINFLHLCPAVGVDSVAGAGGQDDDDAALDSDITPEQHALMTSLVDAIARGAGRCDASALNSNLKRTRRYGSGPDSYTRIYIDNTMPDYCRVYHNHEFTDLDLPKYVGEPLKYIGVSGLEGHWVSSADYETALAQYQQREVQYQQQRRYRNHWGH